MKWTVWTITVLLTAAYMAAAYYGAIDFLLNVDITYITIGIAGLLWLVSVASSVMVFTKDYNEQLLKQMVFIVANFTLLGMLGTTTGLFFAVFEGIPDQTTMMVSISYALTTTMAGIVAKLIGTQLLLQIEEECGYEINTQ